MTLVSSSCDNPLNDGSPIYRGSHPIGSMTAQGRSGAGGAVGQNRAQKEEDPDGLRAGGRHAAPPCSHCSFLPSGVWIQPPGGLLRLQIRRGVWGLLPVLLYREDPEDAAEAEGPGEVSALCPTAYMGTDSIPLAVLHFLAVWGALMGVSSKHWGGKHHIEPRKVTLVPLSCSITTGTATTARSRCPPGRTGRRGSLRSCRTGTWTI